MKNKKILLLAVLTLFLCCVFSTTVLAAGTGDVAGAVESTWQTASGQIKTVVNNVVFPAIDLILAVFFFAKLGTAYFDYRKAASLNGQPPQFCLPVSCSPSPRRCISGASSVSKETIKIYIDIYT